MQEVAVRPVTAFAISPAPRAALVGVLVFTAAVWVGGLVAIAIVARVAQRTLGPGERVSFFRGLGRSYGLVGGIALVLALASGAVLVYDRPWDGLVTASTVVAAVLVAVTVVGVGQARRMTRRRRDALQDPRDDLLADRVHRGARWAAVLRATIAALSLALIALGALLAT